MIKTKPDKQMLSGLAIYFCRSETPPYVSLISIDTIKILESNF